MMKLKKWKKLVLLTLFFLMGAGAGTYLHWPALTNYAVYKSDIRQSPQWAAYHNTSFRSDDLLVQYGSFNESPLQNLIYYVGTFFADVLTLSKVLAVVSYGLGALLFFAVGSSLFGVRGGFFAAVFFTFFPDQFDYSAGFFSKFWMIPLLLVCLFTLKKERWWGLLILLPFSAVAYPVSVVLIAMTALVYLIMQIPAHPKKARQIFLYLSLGSLAAVLILLTKYMNPPSQIGPMTPGKELLSMPEMYRGGLNHYLPVPPLYKELLSHLDNPFIILSGAIYFLVLKKGVAWDRTWTALFIASIISYLLAEHFFIRMYIPNRYTRYSIPVLLILWNARNCDLLLDRSYKRWSRYAIVILLLISAGYLYQDTFRQGKDTTDRGRYVQLNRFIGRLPEKVLIAGYPRYMDDIPIQAKRSVLANYKMAHPWFSTYYKEIKERTLATFRALYATDVGPINELYQRYGVTHLVVGRSQYRASRLRSGRLYVNPYNDYIKEYIRGKKNFLLKSPPRDSVVYDDSKYAVIKLPLKGPK